MKFWLQTTVFSTFLHYKGGGRGKKTLVTVGQNISFLENKVLLNFDFRDGAKKIRSFGPPVAKLWPNIFQYIAIYIQQKLVSYMSYSIAKEII